jgi:hypothetical protein
LVPSLWKRFRYIGFTRDRRTMRKSGSRTVADLHNQFPCAIVYICGIAKAASDQSRQYIMAIFLWLRTRMNCHQRYMRLLLSPQFQHFYCTHVINCTWYHINCHSPHTMALAGTWPEPNSHWPPPLCHQVVMVKH